MARDSDPLSPTYGQEVDQSEESAPGFWSGLRDQREADERTTHRLAAIATADAVPDARARVIRLSRYLDVPESEVESNVAQAKAAADAAGVRWSDLPRYSRQLAMDERTAPIVRDDLDNQTGLARHWGMLRFGFEQGMNQGRSSLLHEKASRGPLNPQEQAEYNDLRTSAREVSGIDDTANEWTRNAAQALGSIVDLIKEAGPTGVAAGMAVATTAAALGQAGPQALVPEEILTLPAGFALGFGTKAFEVNARMQKGEALQGLDALEEREGKKLNPRIKDLTATYHGLVGGALDSASLGVAAGPLRRMFMEATKAALVRPTVQQAAIRWGKHYAQVIATETATETMQEASQILFAQAAMAASEVSTGQWKGFTQTEITDRLADTMVQTAKAMVVLGPFGGAVPFAVDASHARAATARMEQFKQLAEIVGQSKLKDRLPEEFRAGVDEEGANAGIENVYISTEAFTRYFQSKNMDPEAVASELGVLNQLQEAGTDDRDLVIPLGIFTERVVPTDHYAELSKDARFDPLDMSAREATDTAAPTIDDLQTEAQDAIEAQAQRNQVLDESAAKVHALMVEKLVAAGSSPQIAETQARVEAAAMRAIGARIGMDPLSVHLGRPVRIENHAFGDTTPGIGMTLTQEGQNRAVTGDFVRDAAVQRGATSTSEFESADWSSADGELLELIENIPHNAGTNMVDQGVVSFREAENDLVSGVTLQVDELVQAASELDTVEPEFDDMQSIRDTIDEMADIAEHLVLTAFEQRGDASREYFALSTDVVGDDLWANLPAQSWRYTQQWGTVGGAVNGLLTNLRKRTTVPPGANGASVADFWITEALERKAMIVALFDILDAGKKGGRGVTKSAPVLKTGRPVTVRAFHGTGSIAIAQQGFDKARLGANTGAPSARKGFFFSGSPRTSEAYVPRMDAMPMDSGNLLDFDEMLEWAVAQPLELHDIARGYIARLELADKGVDQYFRAIVDQLEGDLGSLAAYESANDQENTTRAIAEMTDTITQLLSEADVDVLNVIGNEALGRDPVFENERRPVIYPSRLHMENPYVHDYKGMHYREDSYHDVIVKAQKAGHDGVILMNTYDGGPLDNIFVVFDADQIEMTLYQEGDGDAEVEPEFDDAAATEQPDVPTTIDGVASLASASEIAGGQQWTKGRDLKVAMQSRVVEAAKAAGVDLSVPSPQRDEFLVRVLVNDTLEALKTNSDAIGWYDLRTRQSLAIAALKFPEIATDQNARLAFTWAVAVTSNGLKVGKNFEIAFKAYEQYRETKVMPNNVGIGTAGKAINQSLDLFNKLVKEWGMDNLRQFMLTEYTVAEITALDPTMKPGGEHASTRVRGASILGPKIGNGFFSNLNGHFDALTMDRWLIRTWGRWTGTLIKEQPANTDNARARLSQSLKNAHNFTYMLDEVLGRETKDLGVDALAELIAEVSTDPAKRQQLNELPDDGEMRKAGNSLAKYLDGQKEAPAGPNERNEIRRVFRNALSVLQTNPDMADLTMADLQAVLWYAERRLYESAKIKDGDPSLEEDDGRPEGVIEKPDYADAAEREARKAGISQRRIDNARKKEERRGSGTAQSQAGQRGDQRAQQGEAGGFTAKAKKLFAGALAIRRARSARKADGKKSWSYTRDDRSADARARVLKGPGLTYTGEWTPGKDLKRVLAANKSATPRVVELEATPANAAKYEAAITASKIKSGAVGAAVYVYPAAEYQTFRMFMSEDGKAGVVVKPDGDIVSLFANNGAGQAMLEVAIAAGGTKLDCFDTILPEMYAAHGMRAVARVPWNEAEKPAGWDKTAPDLAVFNGGEPDVVFMVYDPTYTGWYSEKDGRRFTNPETGYGAAGAEQDKTVRALSRKLKRAPTTLQQEARGEISIGTKEDIIRLFAAQNLSTFLHESGHRYLNLLFTIDHPALAEDKQAILDYLGVASFADIGRDQHEVFARSFEAYLREGKAPSEGLRAAFRSFRDWLVQIYKTAAGLKVNLTPEIRGIFDRLLATDDEIAGQEQALSIVPVLDALETIGATAAEAKHYTDIAARAAGEAREKLLAKSLAQLTKQATAEYRARRTELQDAAREQVRTLPVYQAGHYFRTGKLLVGALPEGTERIRLSKAAIESIYSGVYNTSLEKTRIEDRFRGLYAAEGGVHPDSVAFLFGYDSGEAMLDDIETAPTMAEAVDVIVEKQLREEFGDMLEDGTLEAEAQAVLQTSEMQIQLLAEEVRILRRLGGDQIVKDAAARKVRKEGPRDAQAMAADAAQAADAVDPAATGAEGARGAVALAEAAKGAKAEGVKQREAVAAGVNQTDAATAEPSASSKFTRDELNAMRGAAEDAVAGRKVRHASSVAQFQAEEARAFRKLKRAIAGRHYAEAAQAARQRLFARLLTAVGVKAKDEIAKNLKYLKRLDDMVAGKTIDLEYLEQIHDLLQRFDLRKVSGPQAAKRESLQMFLIGQAENGQETAVPQSLVNEAFRKPYQDMTLEEFRGLVEAVKNIEHLGRLKKKLLDKKRQREFAEVKDAILGQIYAKNKLRKDSPNMGPDLKEKIVGRLENLHAKHTKLEFLFQALDGDEPLGPVWDAFFRPFVDAEAAEQERAATLQAQLNKIFDRVPKKERGRWFTDRVHTIGRKKLTHAELLSVALNWGNDGNRTAIMAGHGWTEGGVELALEAIPDEQWAMVQDIWDLIDSLWPDTVELYRDVAGIQPEKVEAMPFITRSGKRLKGGYYPLAYDPSKSVRAKQNEEKRETKDLLQVNFMRATTKDGHTKTRLDAEAHKLPVLLDLGVIGRHLNDVTHDLTHRRALLDVDRLSQDRDIQAAIVDTKGMDAYLLIRPWLQAIAAGTPGPANAIEKILARARAGTSIVNMGWKVSTAIVQPLGITQTIDAIGMKHTWEGLSRFYNLDMKANVEFIMSRSPQMRSRMTNFDRDVRDTKRMLAKSGHAALAETFFAFTAYADMSVSMPTWLGAYSKGMADFKDESKAIEYADSIVRTSQSAGSMKDLAEVQRGGEGMKLFTAFYSYFNLMYNLFAKAQRTLVRERDVPQFLASMMWIWFIPAIASEIIALRAPDDEDDWAAWALKKELMYPFQSVVVLRDIVNAIGTNFDYQITPVQEAFALVAESVKNAGEFMQEGDTVTRSETKALFNAVGYWAHLPTKQMWITGEAFYRWLVKDEDVPIEDFLLSPQRKAKQ